MQKKKQKLPEAEEMVCSTWCHRFIQGGEGVVRKLLRIEGVKEAKKHYETAVCFSSNDGKSRNDVRHVRPATATFLLLLTIQRLSNYESFQLLTHCVCAKSLSRPRSPFLRPSLQHPP